MLRNMSKWVGVLVLLCLVPLTAYAQGGIQPVRETGMLLSNSASMLAELEAIEAHVDGLEGVLGTTADAAATQGSTGSISAKLRTATSQLNTIVGHVDGLEGVLGATGDSAASAGGTGSLSAKQRLMTTLLDNISSATIAEDSASTNLERLMKLGCRRQDTPGNSSGTDGDWQTVDCKSGGVSVHITGTDVGNSFHDSDYDTGAGTVTISAMGLVTPGAGGPVPVSATNPLPITGSFSADAQPATDPHFVRCSNGSAAAPCQVQSNSENLATQASMADAVTALQLLDNAVSGAGFNTTQWGGNNVLSGAGATGTGSPRVTIADRDPCTTQAKVFVALSQITSTQLFTGTASNRFYVCGFLPIQPADSTQTFSLVNGTGTLCGTDTAAVIGATTAANGMQLPFGFGGGNATIAKSTADAANACLLQSSTDRIAGVLSYVVAPN